MEPVEWKTLSVRVPKARLPEVHRARIALKLSCDAYVRRKIFEELPLAQSPIVVEAWDDFRIVIRSFAAHADFVADNPGVEVVLVEAVLKTISDDLHKVLQCLFNVPAVGE